MEKFVRIMILGILNVANSRNITNLLYQLVDKNRYPSDDVLAVFENVRSVSECGVFNRQASSFFYNAVSKKCVSVGKTSVLPLLTVPGFDLYEVSYTDSELDSTNPHPTILSSTLPSESSVLTTSEAAMITTDVHVSTYSDIDTTTGEIMGTTTKGVVGTTTGNGLETTTKNLGTTTKHVVETTTKDVETTTKDMGTTTKDVGTTTGNVEETTTTDVGTTTGNVVETSTKDVETTTKDMGTTTKDVLRTTTGNVVETTTKDVETTTKDMGTTTKDVLRTTTGNVLGTDSTTITDSGTTVTGAKFEICSYSNMGHSNNWFDAQTGCKSNGGFLLEIQSKQEADFVLSNIISSRPVWLGGIRNGSQFTWVNSGPLTYSDWSEGFPSNIAGDDCLVWTSWGWTDHACNKQHKEVICEFNTCSLP